MKQRTVLAILLIAMMLSDSLNCLKWQGTGSGMNSTVITEIWANLETNIDAANRAQTNAAMNAFTTELSVRLNARWDKAWNVVLAIGKSQYDTVLYGYAFRNQWMWYNGVPNTVLRTTSIFSLIVWKDYNCQDWKSFGNGVSETSSFTTAQKNLIQAEIGKMTQNGISINIWGTAFTMMNSLQTKSEFSSGGYSVIMSQYTVTFYGYVCRVGDGFYDSYIELGRALIQGSSTLGKFYLFQTR